MDRDLMDTAMQMAAEYYAWTTIKRPNGGALETLCPNAEKFGTVGVTFWSRWKYNLLYGNGSSACTAPTAELLTIDASTIGLAVLGGYNRKTNGAIGN